MMQTGLPVCCSLYSLAQHLVDFAFVDIKVEVLLIQLDSRAVPASIIRPPAGGTYINFSLRRERDAGLWIENSLVLSCPFAPLLQ